MSLQRILILLAFLPVMAHGQGFSLGLNPSNIRWNQINTEKVQVIFPVGLEDRAQRAANIVHMLDDEKYYELDTLIEKVSVIVQNQTTVSNGFVTVGPFRTEFFTTPPQFGFGGNVDWWDFLTIHEYRHVQQFSNAKRGITKLGSYVFGQNGWGGFAVVAIPRWFFEGDATFFETALTNAGRGSTPDFDKQYRSLMLADKSYNYEKASAFSFKDFVPNHYNLGYYMTTHVRNEYGQEALNSAAMDAVQYKGLIYPLSKGFKRSTGKGTKALYRETFETLREKWKAEADQLDLTESRQINTKPKLAYTNYRVPVFLNDNTLIAEKSGFRDIRTIVRIDRESGQEQVVTRPGLYSDDNANISIHDNTLVWAERTVDERWGNQNFSVITTYDMQRKKKTKITKRSKYFVPEISPDGQKIVAAEVPESTLFGLHVVDANSGRMMKAIANPDNYFFSFPRWVDNDRVIVVVQHNSRQGLAIVNTNDETFEWLINFQNDFQVSYPRVHGNYAYFSSTRTGIDNIHAVDLSSKEEFQVTSTLLGAIQPVISPNGELLVFSEFTVEGWNLREMPNDPGSWRPIESSYPTEIDFYKPATNQGNILDDVPTEEYAVAPYNKFEGLFQLHSWSPIALHPNYGGIVFFGNKFSTLSASADYQYNVNENRGGWGVNATFAEWYPVLTAGYDRANRNRNTLVYYEEITTNPADTTLRFVANSEWDEDDVTAGVTLPINLTSGNHFGNLQVETNYKHIFFSNYRYNISNGAGEGEQFTRIDQNFGAAEVNVSFSRFQNIASRQVGPRWGQLVDIAYRQTIGTERYQSDYFQAVGRFFFPGFVKTHSWSIRPGIKYEDVIDTYKFRDDFFYARGWDASFADRVWRLGVDYTLPLWLPDIALGPFVFIKRVKLAPYFDFSRSTFYSRNLDELEPLTSVSFAGVLPGFSDDRSSVGAELRFDIRFMRLVDADLGMRYSYLIDDGDDGLSGSDHHVFRFIFGGISF